MFKKAQLKAILPIAALLAFSTSNLVLAEEAQVMDLQSVIDEAEKSNPGIREMEKRWEEKKYKIPVATALPDPQVGLMKDDIPGNTLNPGNAMMTQFSISQEFMNPAKRKAMGNMAESDAAMAKSAFLDKKVEIYTGVKQQYYDLLYAEKSLEIGKQNQQLMGQLAQLAQVNYSTGMVPLQDTLRAQTEFSKMTTDLVNMAAMESIARAKLNTLMGRPTDVAFSVKEEFNAPPPNFDLTSLEKTAAENKPAIRGMENQVEMSKNGLSLANKQKLPDYQIGLGYKTYQSDGGMITPDRWQLSVMAMLPIWDEKNKGQIQSASANLEAAKEALTGMQNMTALDVQMALTEAQAAWRQISLYKNTIIPEAQQTYEAGVVGYTNGKVDFMAVLDSLNALRNAKLDYYKTQIDYEKAIANLEKAVGKPLVGEIK